MWDTFISHASEDKESFVRDLAKALSAFGVDVWYDEATLSVGDSLSKSIDIGLSKSRYGVVVISQSFLSKNWPDYELRGLIAKEIEGKKVILPVWHNISKSQILEFSPTLADKVALDSSKDSVDQIAIKLISVIKPELFERILKRLAFEEHIKTAKKESVDPRTLAIGPIRHKKFPSDVLGRVRLIRAALWGVHTHSMDFWVDGFQRDAHPLKEIAWWEHVSACYTEISKLAPLTNQQHHAAFSVIFGIANGVSDVDMEESLSALPYEIIEKIRNTVNYRYPAYDIEEPAPETIEDLPEEVSNRLKEYDIDKFD